MNNACFEKDVISYFANGEKMMPFLMRKSTQVKKSEKSNLINILIIVE